MDKGGKGVPRPHTGLSRKAGRKNVQGMPRSKLSGGGNILWRNIQIPM